MENEALIVSETNRHEDKNTVDIVFSDEERVEASAGLGTDGRDELEEEVFEEAVEEYLQEQGVKSDITDDTVVGEERKMEVNGDWGLAGVDDIPSVRDEVEKFDEAIGVSGKVGEAKLEAIAPAAEVVGALTEMNSDNGVAVVREIDEGSTDIQLAPDEVNELNNGGLIGGGEDKGNDILHIQEDGETEAPNGVVGGGEDGGKDILDIQVDGETEAPNSVVGDGEDGEKEISEKNATGEIKAENAKEGGGEACDKEGVTVVKLAPDEMNRLNNGDSIGGGEDKGNDILDIQEDGETEAPNGIVGVGENGGKEISGKNAIGEIEADNGKEGGGKTGEREISEIGYGGRVEATYCSVGVEDGEEGTAEVGAGGKIEATNGVCDIDVKEEKPYAQVAKEEEKQYAQVAKEQVEKQSAQVVKEEEKQYAQVAKEQVEKQSAQVNRQQETKPAQQPHASSGKSPNLAPPPARPAGLGRGASLLEPVPRVVQQPRLNGSAPQVQNQQIEEPVNGDAEESDETREKLQMIRVKFLRLAHRLGQTPHNVVVAQVLYRLGLAEQLRGRNGGRVGAFSFDRASAMAEQLEASGNEPLDFSCTIMVLGKTGVGKSATINSIFDEMKFNTDAFQTGTKKVQDVVGTVQGIKVRVIDTPGLLSSWADQRQNEKILHSVKHFIKKTSPDIVLYLDRLDVQNRDFSDMPLLRTITDIFGPSIWFNAIVVLTHAASAPPEGPNGTASSYDMFVTQRSHVVQQAIRQAAGDMRLMNPVSLVENHSACRTNRAGQRVLPNGQVWKPHLLLLSFASKILAEANALLKLQDTPPGKPYTTRSRAPPLPFLLSSLLQSRPQLKLPEEQLGDDDSLDGDLDESSDSDDDSEFDELPPFRRLTKAQVEKLSKAQRKAYFDELEYREKLFMKKQLKEEKKRRKLMKKMSDSVNDQPSDYNESTEEEGAGAASVPVPMPDLALPASFDSDNPTHRFRYLDSSNQWLVRPVLETHGWDHDIGYEGINVERLFAVKNKMPLSFSGQITKDKKDANVQMEVASSIKHGENKATSLGFDMQTVGKDMAYTLRSETRFSNFRRNKASAGVSATLLGDALSAGVKVEDKLIANKRFRLVMTGGAMTGRGDVAYGGSLEAQLRDKDYPIGRSLSTLGLSVMDWHGDLAIGCNIQSQIPVGRNTNLVARANLNNRGAGQVSVRLNSSEQLQIALMGLIPLLRKLHGYAQQLQYEQ